MFVCIYLVFTYCTSSTDTEAGLISRTFETVGWGSRACAFGLIFVGPCAESKGTESTEAARGDCVSVSNRAAGEKSPAHSFDRVLPTCSKHLEIRQG